MGCNAINRLRHLSNCNDWSFGINWLESNCNFIKFYCLDAYIKYGNEHSRYRKIFTIKKEQPLLSKQEVIFEASKKMVLQFFILF